VNKKFRDHDIEAVLRSHKTWRHATDHLCPSRVLAAPNPAKAVVVVSALLLHKIKMKCSFCGIDRGCGADFECEYPIGLAGRDEWLPPGTLPVAAW
jgi:hypothetical protein